MQNGATFWLIYRCPPHIDVMSPPHCPQGFPYHFFPWGGDKFFQKLKTRFYGGGSPKGTIGFMGGDNGGDMTSMGGDIDKSAKMCHHFAFLVYFLKNSKNFGAKRQKFCYFPQIWCRKSKNLQNLQNFRRFAPKF